MWSRITDLGSQALEIADELAGEHLDDLIEPYEEEENSTKEPSENETQHSAVEDRDIDWYRKEVSHFCVHDLSLM